MIKSFKKYWDRFAMREYLKEFHSSNWGLVYPFHTEEITNLYSESDQQLIKRSEKIHFTDWITINPEEAKSPEAQNELKDIRRRKRLRDEYSCGML